MLELELPDGPKVLGETVGRGLVLERRRGRRQHRVEHLGHHGLDQQLLGGEAPVQGAHAHAGPLGDELHPDVHTCFVEGGPGGDQDLVAVASGVPPEGRQAVIGLSWVGLPDSRAGAEGGLSGDHCSAMVPPATSASSAFFRWGPWSASAASAVDVGMRTAAMMATMVMTARKANPLV